MKYGVMGTMTVGSIEEIQVLRVIESLLHYLLKVVHLQVARPLYKIFKKTDSPKL